MHNSFHVKQMFPYTIPFMLSKCFNALDNGSDNVLDADIDNAVDNDVDKVLDNNLDDIVRGKIK